MTSVVYVMTRHVIWGCVIASPVFVQVAEARQRHQLEREEIQRENALERRRLAQKKRQAAAERVHTTSTALQHGHTRLVYVQPVPAQPLLEITALLLSCTAFLLLVAGAAVVLVVVLSSWHGFAHGFVNAANSHSMFGQT